MFLRSVRLVERRVQDGLLAIPLGDQNDIFS